MTFEQKVALYKRLKQDQPDIGEFVDQCAKVWPGAKVVYVIIGAEQFGVTASVTYEAQPGPLWKPEQPPKRRRR